jgi:hypothetical protein
MSIKRRNSINDQWSARRREMLESPAYRALSQSAHRVISRLELELCYHGGNDNGQLPVTFEDFVDYGIERGSIAPALREGEALGFFRITDRGRAGNREYRAPNKFYLTFAVGRGSRKNPPSDEWRKIKTLEEAKEIARTARANKNKGGRTRHKACGEGERKNKKPVRENHTVRLGNPEPKTERARYGDPTLQGQ